VRAGAIPRHQEDGKGDAISYICSCGGRRKKKPRMFSLQLRGGREKRGGLSPFRSPRREAMLMSAIRSPSSQKGKKKMYD